MLSPVPCWVKCIINRRCITSSSLTTLLSSLLFQQLCCSTAIHQTHSENRVHTFLQHSDNQTGVGVQHMLAVHCLWFTSLLSRLIRAAERLRWQMWVATVQPRRGEKSSFSRRVDVRLVPRHDMSWQPVCLSVCPVVPTTPQGDMTCVGPLQQQQRPPSSPTAWQRSDVLALRLHCLMCW